MNRKYVVKNNTPLTIDNKNQRYVLITRTTVNDYVAVIITPAEMVVVHNGLGTLLSLEYSKATGLTISTSTEDYTFGVAVVYFA